MMLRLAPYGCQLCGPRERQVILYLSGAPVDAADRAFRYGTLARLWPIDRWAFLLALVSLCAGLRMLDHRRINAVTCMKSQPPGFQLFSSSRASSSTVLNPHLEAILTRCAVPPGPSGSRSWL